MPVLSVGKKLLPSPLASQVVDMLPSKRLQRLSGIVRTMYKRSTEIVSEKRAVLQKGDQFTLHQVAEGKDIMSILREPPNVSSTVDPNPLNCIIVKANMAASEKEQLSNEEVIAQIS